MSDQDKQVPKVKVSEKSIEESQISPGEDRRRALKKILVGGGVVSGSLMLPNAWVKPAIAQAQTDGAQISPAPTTTGGLTATSEPRGVARVQLSTGSWSDFMLCGSSIYTGIWTSTDTINVELHGFLAGYSITYSGDGGPPTTGPSTTTDTISAGVYQAIAFTTGVDVSDLNPYTITIGGSCAFKFAWN